MIYRLIALNGPLKGQRITIDPEPMTIGRDPSCAIALPDGEVALQHARLEQKGCELRIFSLGAVNKVIVNKTDVQEALIKHSDIIEIGRTRLLVEANVLADVQALDGHTDPGRRRKRKRRALTGAAALLIAGAAFAMIRSHDDAPRPTDSLVDAAPEPEHREAASAPAAGDADGAPIGTEIKQIREDLQFIQQHLDLMNRSAAELAGSERPDRAAGDEPDADGAAEIEPTMLAARKAIEAGDYSEADLILEHLQLEHPDYLPAYQARAELYELWGMPEKAREQWSAVLRRATETELYRKAVVERIRLSRLESQQLISAHDAVRISSIEQVRFRETADYDEMRLVKVHLSYDRERGPIDPNGVRLLVYFFERDLDTQRIQLSSLQPYAESRLADMENLKIDTFTQSISYTVPKGYYQRDHHTSRHRYYGFIARLHYFDRMVDEQARPPKLLEPAILEAAGLALHTADHQQAPDTIDMPVSN